MYAFRAPLTWSIFLVANKNHERIRNREKRMNSPFVSEKYIKLEALKTFLFSYQEVWLPYLTFTSYPTTWCLLSPKQSPRSIMLHSKPPKMGQQIMLFLPAGKKLFVRPTKIRGHPTRNRHIQLDTSSSNQQALLRRSKDGHRAPGNFLGGLKSHLYGQEQKYFFYSPSRWNYHA